MATPGFAPYRTSNNIVLYLSPKQPTPSSVPFELQSYISPEVWADRVPKIARTAGRYSKPIFERIWFALGVLACIVIPAAIWRIAIDRTSAQYSGFVNVPIQFFFDLRLVTMFFFLATMLLFFAPMFVWKAIGKRTVNTMLRNWAGADRMNLGINAALPVWRVVTPGVFFDRITLSISLPQEKAPSNFHPNAYLPSFINAPVDDGGYYKHEKKLSKDLVGAVPLYKDEKRTNYAGTFDELKV
jgi:hypothetical protein